MDKKKIIVTDNVPSQCDGIIMVFEKYLPNYKTEYFVHPEAALRKFPNLENTALVITGLYFQGDGINKGGHHKGFEFYDKIKKINKNIPVIINTNCPSRVPSGEDKIIKDFLENKLIGKDKFYEPKKSGVRLLEIIKENYNIF